jgi:hypothetical protein
MAGILKLGGRDPVRVTKYLKGTPIIKLKDFQFIFYQTWPKKDILASKKGRNIYKSNCEGRGQKSLRTPGLWGHP